MSPKTTRYVFWKALAVRALMGILQRTIMSPDEVFQGPEVAHRLAFGYGFLTWEWLPGTQIRSALYPSFLAVIYKVLEYCHLDTVWLLTTVPVLMHAVIAAVGDYYTFHLAYRIYGVGTANWAFFLQVTSVWGLMIGSRTFTNYLEGVMCVAALYYWPLPMTASQDKEIAEDFPSATVDIYQMKYRQYKRLLTGLAIGLCSCALRPTAAIPWVFMGSALLCYQTHWRSRLYILALVIPAAILILIFQVAVDRIVLGEWLFASMKFGVENLIVSTLFGISSPIWYFTLGLLVITMTWYPFMVYGVWRSQPHQRMLFWMVLFVCAFFSIMLHTEARFVSMVASPCIVLSGYGAHCLCDRTEDGSATFSSNEQRNKHPLKGKINTAVAVAGLLNLMIAAYFAFVHQRGGISSIEAVRKDVELFQRYPGTVTEEGVVRLRGTALDDRCGSKTEHVPLRLHIWSKCHSTPMYSHIHAPIEVIQLDCSPESRVEGTPLDEQFIRSPEWFLKNRWYGDKPLQPLNPQSTCSPTISLDGQYVGALHELHKKGTRPAIEAETLPKHLPTHVIVPTELVSNVSSFLRDNGYEMADQFFHSQLNTDSDAILVIKSFSLFRATRWQRWYELAVTSSGYNSHQ
eukprot:gb/GECG01014532.1/.p1 GENE.gb/GECG01014532.1/~~gb/GECG01014532.1/.p1  ORF type:complete len:630 (+),score=24.75 gb/GECG01014532.1/:1-1890(+)